MWKRLILVSEVAKAPSSFLSGSVCLRALKLSLNEPKNGSNAVRFQTMVLKAPRATLESLRAFDASEL